MLEDNEINEKLMDFKKVKAYEIVSVYSSKDVQKIKKLLIKYANKNANKIVLKLGSATVVDNKGIFKKSGLLLLLKTLKNTERKTSLLFHQERLLLAKISQN